MSSRLVPVLLAAAALALPAVSPIQAQTESHPIVGTWSLDLARSSFDPGPGPQAITRRFVVDDEGFLVSIRTTLSSAGNPTFAMSRLKFGDQGYEVWTDAAVYAQMADGGAPRSTGAFRVIDDHTLELTQRNPAGELNPLSPNTWQVSEDGSTLTVTTAGTNGNGVAVQNVEVYERVVAGG